MQYTGSFMTVSRTGVQVAIVAAVAATGIAIGRWGIPAEDSASAVNPSTNVNRSDRSESIAAEQKLAQMDAADERYSTTSTITDESRELGGLDDAANVVPIPASVLERKFALMDAAEDRQGGLVYGANVAPIPPSVLERKFAQMDAAQDRYSSTSTATHAGGLVDAANVAPIPPSVLERKFVQMDAAADRYSTTSRSSTVKDRLDIKFAQMDADEAR